MKKELNQTLITLVLCLLSFALAIGLDFSLYGQDGYHLWLPIVSEYLNGEQIYNSSAVIFNGQNLAAIYGELPFWKLLRLIEISPIRLLNLTHFMFGCLLWYFLSEIIKGIKNNRDNLDVIASYLLAFFSPIIINRTMAGHFNLMFGILPFFVALSLVFTQSKKHLLISFYALWCAFSIQSYQMLIYHLFYLPILILFVKTYGQEHKKWWRAIIAVTGIAFMANLPLFLKMFAHAFDANNLRSVSSNQVYSYLVSAPQDLWHFIVTEYNPLSDQRPAIYFHEINYGMGWMLLLLAFTSVRKSIKLSLYVTFIVLMFFCMNIPGFNLIAELPLIQAFRVPQRAFMILGLFIPVLFYAHNEKMPKFSFALLTTGFILAQILPYYELFILSALIILMIKNRQWLTPAAALLAFTSIFPGALHKLNEAKTYHATYESMKTLLLPLTQRFTKKELRENVFHFENPNALLLTTVAQSMGIRTMEGYGHPPRNLTEIYSQLTGKPLNESSNILLFSDVPNKVPLLKAFTVDYVVSLDAKNELTIIPVN